MKKYYSAIKEYDTVKRYHPFYRMFMAIVGIFYPKNTVLWRTEQPNDDEALFLVSNHTKIYAPLHFLLNKKKVRVWSNSYFLFLKECNRHLQHKVLVNRKYLKPLAFVLSPLVVAFFRGINPIPVYHKTTKVFTHTFKKSIETMEEGISQVIFPERTENQVNKYVYQFNHGFPLVAKEYYKLTGKIMKFYPVYCATALKTVVIGEPICYDPNEEIKKQCDTICHYLEDKIAELGDGLPEHKPDIYG